MSNTINPWKKKVEEQGINPDDFIELANSGGKLTEESTAIALTVVEPKAEPADESKLVAGSLEALLKELKEIESGKQKAGKHKKISISLDAVTFLKVEIMKKRIEEGFFMEVPISKVIGSVIDEQYGLKHGKKKVK